VPATPQEIFERYVRSAMSRDVDAQADLFATDAVFEAPLVPAGSTYPRRLEGRAELRKGFAEIHRRSDRVPGVVNVEKTRYTLHLTTDPDVFIAEIDAALDVDGGTVVVPFVQIFRLRDGEIVSMRDYFAPTLSD
jgi:ketosteroid isomerase-like protein